MQVSDEYLKAIVESIPNVEVNFFAFFLKKNPFFFIYFIFNLFVQELIISNCSKITNEGVKSLLNLRR